MPPSVKEVARKELLEIVRDTRSLLVLLLLPVFLYPVLMIGTAMVASAQLEKLHGRTYTVWVEDLAQLPAGLRERLERQPNPDGEGDDKASKLRLELVELPAEADVDEALTESDVAVVLRGVSGAQAAVDAGDQASLELLYNGGVDTSSLARRRVERAIEDWGKQVAAQRVDAAGLPPDAVTPVLTDAVDRGQPGALMGRMLAAMVIILALTGSFYPATDLGAGEKERGTLETLLLAPVSRVQIALGKVLAVFVVSLASTLLNLLSLALTFSWFGGMLGEADANLQIDWLLVPVMLVVMIPLVALFSALSLAASTFAASNKEAQAFLTPLLIAGMAPAMMTAIPGFELTAMTCLVPVGGPALLLKELLAGTAGPWQIVLVIGSHLVYAALCLKWVAALYEQEEVLWRPAAAGAPDLLGLQQRKSGAPADPLPSLPQGLLAGVVVLLLMAMVGTRLQAWHITGGLALTLLMVAGVPAAYAWLLRCDLKQTFALKAPPWSILAAVPFLVVAGVVMNLDVVHASVDWGSLDPEQQRQMEQALAPLLSLPFPLLLLLMAVMPAICEELAFRGFVLHGLLREAGPWTAVLTSALLFAVVHLSAARLLPTFLLGLILGLLTVRARSLIPAMLLHALYNGSLVSLQWSGWEGMQQAPGWGMRAAGLVALALGLLIVWRARPGPPPADPQPPEPAPAEPAPAPG